MNRDFWIAVWSWLIAPHGESTGRHGRRKHYRDPKPGQFGGYRGHHRLPSKMDTPEAGAWFMQHRRTYAQAYARAQARVV